MPLDEDQVDGYVDSFPNLVPVYLSILHDLTSPRPVTSIFFSILDALADRNPDCLCFRCALDLLQGVGISFGPDVTKKWCTENKVSAIIRSHEVRQGGIRRCHSQLNCTDASALAIFYVRLSYLLYLVVVRCPGRVAT